MIMTTPKSNKQKTLTTDKKFEYTQIKDRAKIIRLLELSEAIKNKHEARKISTRALEAHKPIYDEHYFNAMNNSDFEDEL